VSRVGHPGSRTSTRTCAPKASRSPKTEQSVRGVPLNQTALAALRRHRARQAEQRLQMGEAWMDTTGLVFTTPVGMPMRGNHILQRHFDPLTKRLGLPRLRLHDLRHTAASLWFDQGYQTEVVSKLLGHSSSTVTSTIYIHVTPEKQREAAAALDRLLSTEHPVTNDKGITQDAL
jgi:integrase